MKRRNFIKDTLLSGSALAFAGSSLPALSRTSSIDIGMQLYSMSTALYDDFIGTLEMLAEVGYKISNLPARIISVRRKRSKTTF